MITYPLNNVDYSAEHAELFHCTRSSGIWAEDAFAITVTGADNTVTIGEGLAWIRNKKYAGKVTALTESTPVELPVADAALPRLDVIAIRFDAVANATGIVHKTGAPASSPVLPEISRTESVYELYLYAIRRNPGAAVITAGDITDLRMDANYCGLMADSVTRVDLDAIHAQIRSLTEEMENATAAAKKTFDPYALVRFDTVWENPDTTAEFGAKTVALDLSGCHGVAVEYLETGISNLSQLQYAVSKIQWLPAQSGRRSLLEKTTHEQRYYRQIDITDEGLVFGTGMVDYTGNTATGQNAAVLVPCRIHVLRSPELT